jgi:NADH-quinone oxidoreductase subunit F
MAKTMEITSALAGKIKPDSVEEYVNAGGYAALKKAIGMQPVDMVEEIKKSTLMGRGGAAYPVGKSGNRP